MLGYVLGSRTTTTIDLGPTTATIDSLNIEITKLTVEVTTYKQVADSLSYELAVVDSSANKIKRAYDDKKIALVALPSDSLASILSERYGVFSVSPQ